MKFCGAKIKVRGSAVLLVMWALLLLSAAVLAWALWVQDEIQMHGAASRDFEARAMAHSGLALGIHPLVSQKTPLLEEELAPGMGYRVKLRREGGKLNLNFLLRGEEPRKLAILKQWLEQRGLEFQERETLVDCLLDYVDTDNVARLNGAEDDGEYRPANRELRSIEELAQVRGAEPLVSQAGWQDDLTIFSQGKIDVTAAPVRLLRLLPGLSEARVTQFVEFRAGRDGIDDTLDDNEFKTLRDVQLYFGLSDAQFQELGGLVTQSDPTLRVISEGHSGNAVRQVEVVVRKAGGNPQILFWKE